MTIPILADMVIIFLLAIPIIFVCHKLRIPSIVGFLLTGILAGPYGAGFIKAVHEVEIMAEVGVVLLLFTIGIEFSLKGLMKIKRAVFAGGLLQVGLTTGAAFLAARGLGIGPGRAVFLGFIVSLSSTAIVLKLLQERAEIDSPRGKISLAVLIFQDIAIVPMMLAVPFLAGSASDSGLSPLGFLLKGLGLVLAVIVASRWVVPKVLYHVAATRSRELFLLSIMALCLATSWLTSSLGLSLALGAFMAGLVISESDYSHQALSSIMPFRDVFASFFFISVGMLLDLSFFRHHAGLILLVTGAVIAGKSLLAAAASMMLGYPLRVTLIVGLTLFQIGEFSFILSRAGLDHGLLDEFTYSLFIAVTVLTMAVTPFVLALAPRLADLVLKLPLPARLKQGLYPTGERTEEAAKPKDHVIIVGFGVGGRSVARTARAVGIPYTIVEMNPETVRAEKSKGEPILYGDAGQEAVLRHAGIDNARVVVAVTSDSLANLRVTGLARELNPSVQVIGRTRFMGELASLYEQGADDVVAEEFEASIEIFALVLMKYMIPRDEIEAFISEARAGGYRMLRSTSTESASLADLKLNLSDFKIQSLRVCEGSGLAGKTPAQLDLRARHGITLLAIRRGTEIIEHPGPDTKLLVEDICVVMGKPETLASAGCRFTVKPPEAPKAPG
jgi:CPA2 family monovalent cation:H+ antiporter-2